MDYLGLLLLTAAIVLLIFGLSDGNVEGFDRAQSIAPLVIGVLLFPAFFFWETRMDPLDALINPATWHVKNFTLLTVLSLVPYVSDRPADSSPAIYAETDRSPCSPVYFSFGGSCRRRSSPNFSRKSGTRVPS